MIKEDRGFASVFLLMNDIKDQDAQCDLHQKNNRDTV
jgi:hypothetical protein